MVEGKEGRRGGRDEGKENGYTRREEPEGRRCGGGELKDSKRSRGAGTVKFLKGSNQPCRVASLLTR